MDEKPSWNGFKSPQVIMIIAWGLSLFPTNLVWIFLDCNKEKGGYRELKRFSISYFQFGQDGGDLTKIRHTFNQLILR